MANEVELTKSKQSDENDVDTFMLPSVIDAQRALREAAASGPNVILVLGTYVNWTYSVQPPPEIQTNVWAHDSILAFLSITRAVCGRERKICQPSTAGIHRNLEDGFRSACDLGLLLHGGGCRRSVDATNVRGGR